MTTRLLVVADAGKPTGFERVARGICTHLHESGDYTIVQRGIQFDEATATRRYPWTVKSWCGSPEDPYGVRNFHDWLVEDRPDAVLLIDDVWNITNYLPYKPRELPAVAYFPVDCPNLKWNHVMGIGACAEAATYTRFGAVEAAAGIRETLDIFWEGHRDVPEAQSDQIGYLQYPNLDKDFIELRLDRMNRYQNPSNWNVIPHGLTPGLFQPRDKAQARKLFGFPEDAFIVLNVNANQFRKRLDLTIRAFAYLHRLHPEALLVLHSSSGDLAGWDVLQLARYYGVEGRIVCVHYQAPQLTEDQLCWLYNTADVQLNTAGAEAWGLTSHEGAACGIPQLTTDWGPAREVWGAYAQLLPVSDWRNEPRMLNTAHAQIDVRRAGEYLCEFAELPYLREVYRKQALARSELQVTWDQVGAAFHTLIQRALKEPPAEQLGFAEVFRNREADVQSALAHTLYIGDSSAQ